MPKDRRYSKRYSCKDMSALAFIGGEEINGTIIDFSRDGFLFESEAVFHEGDVVTILFVVPPAKLVNTTICSGTFRVHSIRNAHKIVLAPMEPSEEYHRFYDRYDASMFVGE